MTGSEPLVKIRAVLEDRVPAWLLRVHWVGEAASLELHVEAQRQRVTRLERLLEGVDVVTVLAVRDHPTECTIERHARLHVERRLQMHGVDRHRAPIHESVAAADHRCSAVGINLDAQIRTDTHRLRNPLVLPVALRSRRGAQPTHRP